jgi:hypothetical protein
MMVCKDNATDTTAAGIVAMYSVTYMEQAAQAFRLFSCFFLP